MYYLSTKYVEKGECAIITYYIPMLWSDYFVITAIGVFSVLLSYFLERNRINHKWIMLEIFIYSIIVILVCLFGNELLSFIECKWPHNYHPTPYIEIIK